MSELRTSHEKNHSLSYHQSILSSKDKFLPKLTSHHSKTFSCKNISDKTFTQNNKPLNLLEFPSLFLSKIESNVSNTIPETKKAVFLTGVHEILKLCNPKTISKKLEKPFISYEASPIQKTILQKLSFNDLRKKSFKLNNLLYEDLKLCRDKNALNKKNPSNFSKHSKVEENERKYNEIHIKKIEIGRERHLARLFSKEKEKEFFEEIKRKNLTRTEQYHLNKLFMIKNFAGIIKKETNFQNRNFKDIFTAFTDKFEDVLKL